MSILGTALGLAGAAAFNLAGLVWAGGMFQTALYWDPLESGITVMFGCLLLCGWAASAVAVLLVSRVGVDPSEAAKLKRLGNILAGCGLLLVLVGLVVALSVLPAQYNWVKY